MAGEMRRNLSDRASSLISKLHLAASDIQVTVSATDSNDKPTRKMIWPPEDWFRASSSRQPSPQPSPRPSVDPPPKQRVSLAPMPHRPEEESRGQKLSMTDSDEPLTLAGLASSSRSEAPSADSGVQIVDEPADISAELKARDNDPEVINEEPEEISDEPQTISQEPDEMSESPADLRPPQLAFTAANEKASEAGRGKPVMSSPEKEAGQSRTSPIPDNDPPLHFPDKTPSKQDFPFPSPPLHPMHRSTGSEVKETLGARTSTHHDGTRMLNQYILLQTLGRGAFGLVLEAIDAETGEEFAIKELNRARLRRRAQKEAARKAREVREQVANTEGRQPEPHPAHVIEDERTATQIDALYLVRNEIAIMKKVNHPNVVRLYEVLDAPSEDALYMVLEICKGGPIMSISLDQSQPSKPLDPKETHEFFRQIVSGVSYLHANEIVHHDIKPDNILTSADRKIVKLADFGVSAIFEKPGDDSFRDGTSAANVASPAFAAPEQFGHHQIGGARGVHGRAADIWSLGVTLVCMLTGRLPFEEDTMIGLYDAITTKEPSLPDSLSPDLRDLLVKLLDKNPDTRIKMAELRQHPWVTERGRRPLPPISEHATPISPVTQADLDNALFMGLHSLRQQFHEAVDAARKASKQHADQHGSNIGDGHRRVFFKALKREIVTRSAASRRDIERSWLEWRERSKSRASEQSMRRTVSKLSGHACGSGRP